LSGKYAAEGQEKAAAANRETTTQTHAQTREQSEPNGGAQNATRV